MLNRSIVKSDSPPFFPWNPTLISSKIFDGLRPVFNVLHLYNYWRKTCVKHYWFSH